MFLSLCSIVDGSCYPLVRRVHPLRLACDQSLCSLRPPFRRTVVDPPFFFFFLPPFLGGVPRVVCSWWLRSRVPRGGGRVLVHGIRYFGHRLFWIFQNGDVLERGGGADFCHERHRGLFPGVSLSLCVSLSLFFPVLVNWDRTIMGSYRRNDSKTARLLRARGLNGDLRPWRRRRRGRTLFLS